MAMFFNVLRIACLLIAIVTVSSQKRVETKLGGVVGRLKKTLTGKTIYSFLGIPYAKPPVGELRFKAPQPAEPWDNDIDNESDLHMCKQKLYGSIMGTEDCLVLHVHTPWDPSTSLPRQPYSVMVFIHGGGFTLGSASSALSGNPDYLLEHDVVLVMINYRLGAFGFLSTSDEEATGNYGLLDQVAALKWVKDNIASFGGNPDQVTIFGESAGGASVHFLMLSPLAKGLFHGAIVQSGAAIATWATTRMAKLHAQTLGKKAKCPMHYRSSELIKCLRKANDSKLAELTYRDNTKISEEAVTSVPRIDIEAEDPLLPDHPIEIMEKGHYNKVPLMIGFNKDEGAILFAQGKERLEKLIDHLTNHWHQFCSKSFAMKEFLVSKEFAVELCDDIRRHYIGDSEDFEKSKMDYIKMFGHMRFVSPILKSGQLMSRHSPVYVYQFNYESETMSLLSMLFPGVQKLKGTVSHAHDLLYLFRYPQTNWTTASPEYEMVQMMSKLWTDFAKTGSPKVPNSNVDWPQPTEDVKRYVILDTQPSVTEGYMEDDMDFLDQVFGHFLYNTSVVEMEYPRTHAGSSYSSLI